MGGDSCDGIDRQGRLGMSYIVEHVFQDADEGRGTDAQSNEQQDIIFTEILGRSAVWPINAQFWKGINGPQTEGGLENSLHFVGPVAQSPHVHTEVIVTRCRRYRKGVPVKRQRQIPLLSGVFSSEGTLQALHCQAHIILGRSYIILFSPCRRAEREGWYLYYIISYVHFPELRLKTKDV